MGKIDSIEAWQKFYKSSNPEVQKRALQNIVKLTDVRLTPTLLDALPRYSDQGFGASIVKALIRIHDPLAVEPLISYLQHSDPSIREMACEILGRLEDKRATMPLTHCLDDANMWVRREAAYALAFIGDRRALPSLLQRYTSHKDDDYNVIRGLESALKQLDVVPVTINEKEYRPEAGNFRVILSASGNQSIQVIAALREVMPALNLLEAKHLVERTPIMICEGINAKETRKIETKLKAVGAIVKIENTT